VQRSHGGENQLGRVESSAQLELWLIAFGLLVKGFEA
jgi:hypothetical protein